MKSLKQFLSFMLLLVITICSLVGCKKDDTIKIGILQLATHSALDSAREGFIAALEEAGYIDGENIKITVRNPEGDTQTLVGYATELVRENDIVLGIATNAAVQLQTARETEQTDCVILFTAVTDPVSAGLVEANDKTTNKITGTNDMNPVAEQVDLIKELLPEIKKVGIIYNVAEENSLVQANLAKAEAEKNGIEVIIKTVADASEISATTSALVTEGAEAMYLLTDNLIASNMPAIVSVCDGANIPTICGESGMIAQGGTITYSISYLALGKLTGQMAVKIIKGTSVTDIPVGAVDINGVELVVNQTSLDTIGLDLPQSIKDKLNK